MTPWKHSESSVQKWGGEPEDYIEIHQWLDETKQYTGDWRHRAMRHHSAGVEWGIKKFGHAIVSSNGRKVPVKMILERHITEDCGFVPTPQDWLNTMTVQPWMLKVQKKSIEMKLVVE
ncbi:MAG: hypothetical protein CMA60_05690 [Euryarchaeota archaeon]|nr:hypothetical protein [Euryarchaeota archaeon]|tara:strand:+ start:21202 stop:21555 length:354 start_codon:yes stop_codon:yes gene_type:complete